MYSTVRRVVQNKVQNVPSLLPIVPMFHSHPLTLQAARRWSTHAHTTLQQTLHNTHPTSATRIMEVTTRWKKNFARLYARRMIELAIASAAAYKVRSMLAAACGSDLGAVDKPKAWQNWQAQDWEETAMASLGNSKVERFWIATSRMISLAILASPLTVLYPLSYISPKAHDAAWKYALWGIEQAGPTWIKLVQWATTRQDLFSPEFCQYFGKLRDDTEGHAWHHTVRILDEELGQLGKDVLRIEPTPIGSGCIAQVYQGTLLKATGQYPVNTKVAIKVQHPGIWHKVCTDFYILHKFAKWLEAIPRLRLYNLSLSDTVRQFRDIMLPQLDLTLEAQHLKRFGKDFSNDDQISFPQPLSELTTTQILTETFVEGKPILDYTKGTEQERKQIALLGLETTLKMIFLNDFVHGDMHPGNILISGSYPKLKMHLLDCGIVLEMGPEQHVNLVRVLGAFTRRDGRLAGKLMVDLKSESQATEWDVEMFIRGIEQICILDEDQNFIEKVGDYITDICYLACTHHVKLESAFINAALAVEIMEGIAAALYPDMRVQGVALPLIVKAEMMHRMGFH